MKPQKPQDQDPTSLDQAARAAWLAYIGGMTQDQIAAEMGISRQRAQRLVSRAMAEGLVHVRLEHRVARCLELEASLSRRYGLRRCRVALGLGPGIDPVPALAPIAAEEIERVLVQEEPKVVAMGTGRTLRASIEEMRRLDCPQHKIVSLNGNIAPDGSASFFDVIMRIADKVRAPHFPMPLPVLCATPEEREVFHAFAPVARTRALAKSADIDFVGIGEMAENPPLLKDGFLTQAELDDMQAAGAAGEILGWVFDDSGKYLSGGTNTRVAGVRLEPEPDRLSIGIAAGKGKLRAIRGALNGNLINGLITDEATAEALLDD
ncbi:sugar-binding transcriptional regulator [Halovulum sp. GXIMD14794]